jgi:hypothetical protein
VKAAVTARAGLGRQNRRRLLRMGHLPRAADGDADDMSGPWAHANGLARAPIAPRFVKTPRNDPAVLR